jgi:apolipoprotein N-acyltransferase
MDSAFFEISYTAITIVLLGLFLYRSLHRTSHHFSNWFAFGFVFNFYSLSWLYTVYPLDWLSPGKIQLAGISLMLFILAVCGGVGFAIVGFAFTKKISGWQRAFVFPFLLVFAEILRSLIFSFIFSGNGGTIGLHWTAGTVGNALSSTPLIEYAYFGGTYMLTAVLGFLLITLLMKDRLNYWYGSYLALVIGFAIIHYGVPTHAPQSPLRVAVITTDFAKTIPPSELEGEFVRRFRVLNVMTQTLQKSNVDIIAYPEDAQYTKHLSNQEVTDLSASFPSTLFVDGDTRMLGGKLSNFSLFFSPENRGQVLGRGKVFLFPFSEYLPSAFESLFTFFVTDEELSYYKKTHSYTPQTSIKAVPFRGEVIGTLICSEILSYQTLQNLSKEAPSLIIFQSYLSIFNGKMWFSMHNRSFSKVAAAQLRTPLISSANGAESYVVSPFGKMISVIPRGFGVSILEVSAQQVKVSQ